RRGAARALPREPARKPGLGLRRELSGALSDRRHRFCSYIIEVTYRTVASPAGPCFGRVRIWPSTFAPLRIFWRAASASFGESFRAERSMSVISRGVPAASVAVIEGQGATRQRLPLSFTVQPRVVWGSGVAEKLARG